MSSKDASKQIPEADFPSLDAHNQTTIKGCCSSILLYVAYQKCLEGVSIMCMPEDHAAKL